MCVNLRLIYVGLLTFTMVIPSGWGWAQEQSAETSEPPKPPPDEFVWESEDLTRADVRVLEFDSLGDDASLFSISKHKQIFTEMVFATADNEDSNCSRQLVQAIYLQDIGHFFDANAHFDNCTFDGSIDYIESLLGEADDLVKSAHTHRDGGQYRRGGTAVAEAMTRLGQVLHAVQDFYAHSNYVDLMDEWETAYDNIDPIQLWNASGRTKIQGLIRRGLVSGTVAWQPTQNVCPDGTPSHGDLNKDSDDGSPPVSVDGKG